MTVFTKGDRVKFNDTSDNRRAYPTFTPGKAYIVDSYQGGFTYVVDDNGSKRETYPTRWTKIDPAPYNVGDLVRITHVDTIDVKKGVKVGTIASVTSFYQSVYASQRSYVTLKLPGRTYAMASDHDMFYLDQIEPYVAPTVAPATSPYSRSYKAGDWVMLDFGRIQPNNSRFQTGKKYLVRHASPSGKTIRIEGVSGGTTSADRFVPTTPPKATMTTPVGSLTLYGSAGSPATAQSTPTPTRKSPKAIVVPTEELYGSISRYLKEAYGVVGDVASVMSDSAGHARVTLK